MEMRQRRGKQMPMMAPPSSQVDDSSSDTESSESESGSDSSPRSEDDTALVEGEGVEVDMDGSTTARETERMDLEEEVGEEEEEEDFLPPPTPRVATTTDRDRGRTRDAEREDTPLRISDTQDVGRIFNELILDVNSLASENTADEEFHEEMSKNIKKGQAVFEYMMKGSLGQQADGTGLYGSRRRTGPNDIYLALQHTKAASDVIRAKAERMGSGPSIFSVDSFLDNLKKEFVDEDRQYSQKLAAANIAMQSSLGSNTLMPLVAVVGTYDRDAVLVPKPKKVPLKRTANADMDEPQEGTTVDDGANMPVAENNPAENIAKGMNKILKTACRQSSDPVNLFEFVMDRGSFQRTIENLFYFGFLVKDGHVSLTKEDNGRLKDLSLNVKPEKSQKIDTKSPDEGEGTRNQTNRQTYILSFSPRQWKSIAAMSQGEDTMAYFQSLMEKQPLAAIENN